jgi:molecular chaperone HscB
VTQDYFALFGLPLAFDLDVATLAARYRELQHHLHPDKHAHAPDEQRRLSVQMTANLNQAFHTLKDPIKRGRYLLQLQGVATDDETDTVMDPGFLAEQMALREELEEIQHDPDAPALLTQMARDVEERLRERTAMLKAAFAQADDPRCHRARNLVREMQFLEKLLRQIENLQEEML